MLMMSRRLNRLVVVLIAALVLTGASSCRSQTTARASDVPAGTRVVSAVTGGLVVGAPLYYEGLTVFPLYREAGVEKVAFKTLEQALADGSVEVRELDTGASVPELQVVNKGKDKVLIIGGEELVGAKQNRIVNTTMILDGNTETTIPVSCVEAGRWTYKSEQFAKGEMANPKMRAANTATVQKSVAAGAGYDANQGRVWNDVSKLNADLGVSSSTSAMHDGIAAQEERLKGYAAAIRMPAGAAGYIAMAGDEPLGADLFASPGLFAAKWDELLRSAAIEILRMSNKPGPASDAAAAAFLKKAVDSVGNAYAPPGLGRGYHIDSADVVGNVVELDGKIAHLSAFPKPAESDYIEPMNQYREDYLYENAPSLENQGPAPQKQDQIQE